MKAKDTVEKYQCNHKVKIGSKEWHNIEGYNLGAQTQAEISFKAGIKEVVEWVEEHDIHGGLNSSYILTIRSMWQAKLKEWGLK